MCTHVSSQKKAGRGQRSHAVRLLGLFDAAVRAGVDRRALMMQFCEKTLREGRQASCALMQSGCLASSMPPYMQALASGSSSSWHLCAGTTRKRTSVFRFRFGRAFRSGCTACGDPDLNLKDQSHTAVESSPCVLCLRRGRAFHSGCGTG